jgi:hypothetical protein
VIVQKNKEFLEGYDIKPCSLKVFKGLLSNVIGGRNVIG